MEVWQLKTHAALTQGYLAKLQAYELAMREVQSAAQSSSAGGSPALKLRIVQNELRKQALALLTGEQFDGFGALEISAEHQVLKSPWGTRGLSGCPRHWSACDRTMTLPKWKKVDDVWVPDEEE